MNATNAMSTRRALAVAIGVGVLGPAGGATAKPMRQVARIAVADGVIGEGFALDEVGVKLAYTVTDGRGNTRLHAGPPGALSSSKGTNLTAFSSAVERVLAVGPGWFVVANEGQRRAAAIAPNGSLAREIGPFSDAFPSTLAAKGPLFVTVNDRGERAAGHVYDIAAYRSGGISLGAKALTLGADGAIAGAPGLTFQAFTNGYLQALVKRPGRYNAKADARAPSEVATYDVLTGAVSGAHRPGDLRQFADMIAKRAERPGVDVFVRQVEGGSGLELVGPGEKVRPLAFPGTLAQYEPGSLQHQQNGRRLYLGLVWNPVAGAGEAPTRNVSRALHVFEVSPATARATALGEIRLGDDQKPFTWVAGGAKVAFMRKNLGDGGSEIVIFSR